MGNVAQLAGAKPKASRPSSPVRERRQAVWERSVHAPPQTPRRRQAPRRGVGAIQQKLGNIAATHGKALPARSANVVAAPAQPMKQIPGGKLREKRRRRKRRPNTDLLKGSNSGSSD